VINDFIPLRFISDNQYFKSIVAKGPAAAIQAD
jgi:hypothetical protein